MVLDAAILGWASAQGAGDAVAESSKRAVTSRSVTAMPSNVPSPPSRGWMVNSAEIVAPSYRSAGTDSRSPSP